MKTTRVRASRVLMGLVALGWSFSTASAQETTTVLFQASLVEDVAGQPVKKGGTLAMLDGNDLHLTVFFASLRHPWAQIDLYRGDPKTGGENIQNLALTVPTSTARSGGVATTVTLSEAQVEDLNAGGLYLYLLVNTGNPDDHFSGAIQILPMAERQFAETGLSEIWQGFPATRGRVLVALEEREVRLVGFFAGLSAPWARIDLYRGALGTPGTLVQNLLLNPGIEPEPAMGFDLARTLSEADVQALLDGSLYLEVQSFQADERLRGQLLLYPNEAPEASQILSPGDGETVVIGGTDGAAPVDPNVLLGTVSFTAVADPNDDPVAYLWQTGLNADFTGRVVTFDLGVDSTRIRLSVAGAAALFDSLSGREPGNILLETPVTLYHRVLTTDGARYTIGAAAQATFIRGTITATESADDVPGAFTLHGNYPNPFNPNTTIVFDLPWRAEVRVEVFDLLGRQVLTQTPGTLAPGAMHSIEIDGSLLPSGTYLYRVSAEGEHRAKVATGTMILIK